MDPLWMNYHPLVQALVTCPSEEEKDNNWKKDLQLLIEKYENEGWSRHEDIPDSLPQIAYPLVLWACALVKPCLLKWLIEQGLNPLIQKKDTKENGLHCALDRINKKCSCEQFGKIVSLMPGALLHQNNCGDTPFHIACKEMSIDGSAFYRGCFIHMLQTACKQGLDFMTKLVNCQNVAGDTPLHLLSHHEKCYLFVKSLLSDGKPDVSIRNKKDLTPLDIAITCGTMKISSILTSYSQTSGKPAKSPDQGEVELNDTVKIIDDSEDEEKPQRKKPKRTSMAVKTCQTSPQKCKSTCSPTMRPTQRSNFETMNGNTNAPVNPVAHSIELAVQKQTSGSPKQGQPPRDDLKPSNQSSGKSTSTTHRSTLADSKVRDLGIPGQGLIAYLSMSDETRSLIRDTLLRDQQDSLQQLKKIETEVADVSIELQSVQEEKDKKSKVIDKMLTELEEHQVQLEKLARRSVLLRQEEADKQKQLNKIKEKIKTCETALNDLQTV
ncbi:hypothetical protein CHS0354_011514 [Potamilus streckersoni]|uniref:Uncharacterized protein n=1 Tax=Potamilus streckersoni TaxID=2493646 RepID=A0AAE0VXR9_9BIVA|nr:hypothetical protein CHS0354_011514 [Potamilus streckersoni]